MICDRCIHNNICVEGSFYPGLIYCYDFLGWTPVREKIPDIHNRCEDYLVTLKRGGIYITKFTECNGKHWWTYDDVVAWMPLQEPYKTESE